MDKLRNSTHETYAAFASERRLEQAPLAFEEMKRAGFFKNAYRNVRKAYFDRGTTQSEFCFETNILCNRWSSKWGRRHFRTSSRYLGKQTAERLPMSSSFTVFYSCLKPVLHNFKIFIGFRDHYE